MIRIAICDDQPAQLRIVIALLEKYQVERPGIELLIQNYSSGAKLIKSIYTGSGYDLLLLDILMPGLDGIELAKEIRKHNEDASIIFQTSSKDHALDAYSVSAVQYILKPINERKLFPILDSIFPTFNKGKERLFLLSTLDREVKIPFSSIVCVELDNRRLCVHLDNSEKLYGRYIRTTFAEAVAPLLQDSRFFCPHKSFVINVEKAEELVKDAFVMKNNIHVPISRFKFSEAKKVYFSFVADSSSENDLKRGVP